MAFPVTPLNDYRVTLRASTATTKNLAGLKLSSTREVKFDVTPEITESRSVQYKTLDPIHLPGSINVYASTGSRTFQISNARFISRTIQEASNNLKFLHTLRGWTEPFFGNSGIDRKSFSDYTISDILQASTGVIDNLLTPVDTLTDLASAGINKFLGIETKEKELLGKPPQILLFSAYSAAGIDAGIKKFIPSNISKVPCVITNLTIPYPSDVDYIPTVYGVPFPRIITLDIQLTETHSPQEYERFRLQDFREGKLDNF